MTDAIQIVAEGVAGHWTLAVPYAVGCAGAFSVIQSIKLHRRERGARRATALELRLTAAAVSAALTYAVAAWLFGWPTRVAATHAGLCAILYPIAITAIMELARARWPGLYTRLRVPERHNAPRRPQDTGSDDVTRHY